MRTALRRTSQVMITLFLVMGALQPIAAYEIDVDDPTLFGPGDAWQVPAAVTVGNNGPWVRRLQEQLADAGFRPGVPDGRFSQATLGAVYAFQKLHDLERDGMFRAEHWDLLGADIELPVHTGAPDRVEVDLAKQVLFLVKDHQVEAVLPISSGNGDTYRNSRGASVRARTPEGGYQFYKRVNGWRISYLGGLYRPFYFRGGYAIHGSSSVPPYPASHGCVRVALTDMDYLAPELELGMPLFVYGQRVARHELFPGPDPRVSDSGKPLTSRLLPTIS